MIKTTYHFFHRTTIFLSIVLFIITIILTHKYTLVFLAEKFLKTNDVHYSKVQGTLFNGVILYDVKYKNILKAKKIQLNYKLLSFVELEPIIKTIKTQNLYLNLDKIPYNEQSSKLDIIPFKVLDIKLKKTTLIIEGKKYLFDFTTKNLVYNKTFSTKHFFLNLHSFYANAVIEGKIDNNRLKAHSKNVVLSDYVCKHYLHFIQKIPHYLAVDIALDKDNVQLSTFIDYFVLRENNNIVLSNQKLTLSYLFHDKKYTAKYDYNLKYLDKLAKVKQSGEINLDGEYHSTANVVLVKHPKIIPVDNFDANISGNFEHISFDINSSDYHLNAVSNDFNKYYVKLKNQKMQLSFFDALPNKIKRHRFSLNSYSAVVLSPLNIDTIFHTEDSLAHLNGTFKYKNNALQLTTEVEPKLQNKFYKKYNLKLFTPIDIIYNEYNTSSNLSINANQLHLFINKQGESIDGYGNLSSAIFTLKGKINHKMQPSIKIHTTIASINKLLHELQLVSKNEQTVYDGAVNINSTLNFKDTFSMLNTVEAPWLSARTNSQNKYVLTDTLIRSSYKNKVINIYNYKTKYKEQKFYSNKLSHIHLDNNATIYVDEFCVYDNLILKGIIHPFQSRMKLNLHSDNFAVKTHNMNLHASTNINIDVENTARQDIDGNITLLSGNISYLPQHDYAISDDDIIIVQDMQKEKSSNLHLNINLIAVNPIRYKTKQADVLFIPDVFVLKDAGKKIKYKGKVTILRGKVMAQDKEFSFDKNDKSEVIFTGKAHFNPQLNLKLHYQTIDYKDIIILITNTLNAPILIFSSNPAMSQNDIMSYILFDEPADTLFDNSGLASKMSINYLILGTGIKTIFNKGTGIKVDTLNILNNENGTLGYEVGARFNKKIRILYKNDVASSVILQYSLAPSLRVDVDVHDTGQGVYFIYTKDMEGF
ncbi:translocation/assembly module TamB domain-containing protein [Sulfurimonas sp.]|uniref:translocation/assembly module TamB domain-containing protein n=1 Tax=Sulfurimonas sp. TaxID=2022749 RepID=UPI0026183C83|nr:translocation/assembly module TamB domain-containing protein [Sulfurimonas sp.]